MDVIFGLELLEDFTNVSKEILINLYDSNLVQSANADPHIIQTAKKDVKKLIADSNYDFAKVAESLHRKGWEEHRLNIFISLLDKEKPKLLYKALLHHNSTYGESVTDFHWLLKLVLGTNDLKMLRYPLLQLILSTINSSGEQRKHVYDINKDMLAKIINVLESIDEI